MPKETKQQTALELVSELTKKAKETTEVKTKKAPVDEFDLAPNVPKRAGMDLGPVMDTIEKTSLYIQDKLDIQHKEQISILGDIKNALAQLVVLTKGAVQTNGAPKMKEETEKPAPKKKKDEEVEETPSTLTYSELIPKVRTILEWADGKGLEFVPFSDPQGSIVTNLVTKMGAVISDEAEFRKVLKAVEDFKYHSDKDGFSLAVD